MKLVDANLLVYSVNESAPQHELARKWLEETLAGDETVGFAWIVLMGFLRLTTRAPIFPKPLPTGKVLDLMELWLDQPCATIVHPGERHFEILRKLLLPFGTAGNITTDAHLAAIAIEHGAEVCSTDADFGRFADVRWRNPLAGPKGKHR
jgi:toxin-antitoxin system PIN domain toxin